MFKVDKTGKETLLYAFTGADGESPVAGLVRDAQGNLYGTTTAGGAYAEGTVFMLDTSAKETVLYSFTGGADGADPNGRLVRDAQGNLYGTTFQGGSNGCNFGCGVAFKVDVNGTETVLYTFTGIGGDGGKPLAGLVLDNQGNLYGTTSQGGTGYGTVFELSPQ